MNRLGIFILRRNLQAIFLSICKYTEEHFENIFLLESTNPNQFIKKIIHEFLFILCIFFVVIIKS